MDEIKASRKGLNKKIQPGYIPGNHLDYRIFCFDERIMDYTSSCHVGNRRDYVAMVRIPGERGEVVWGL